MTVLNLIPSAGLPGNSPPPLRVLIVSGDPPNVQELLSAIRKSGYNPAWKIVETEADFSISLAEPFDLILMDHQIRGWDGFEGIRQVKAAGLDTPVILISGATNEEAVVHAMQAGAADFLPKSRLGTLGISIRRVMEQLTIRREKQKADEASYRLAAIVASSEDAIVGKTLEGIITSWNRGAEKIFGYTEQEVIGKPVTILIPANRWNEEPRIIEQIRRGNTIEHFETVRVRKDGSLIDISLTISPIRDPRGNIIGASKIARNITDQKRAQEELKTSRERLELAQQAANIGIFEWDIETNGLIWSRQTEALYGFAPGEFKNQYSQWSSRLLPEELLRVEGAISECMRLRTELNIDFRISKPGEGVRWILALGHFFYGPEGKPLRMLGVNLDITERKSWEEKIRQANNELKRLDRIRQEFIAMISHELRTPLTAIRSGLDLTLDQVDGPVNEAQQKTLTVAQSNVDRLARLVQNILEFSRITSGRWSLSPARADLNQLMREACDLMLLSANKKGVRLECAAAPDGLELVCDRDKVLQILINLVDNAVKYTPPGGRVSLTPADEGNCVRLSVSDTGVGVEASEQDTIFDLFEQSSTTRQMGITGGIGVGLAVSKKLAEQHGGHITVESKPGKGSTFSVILPKNNGLKDGARGGT